MYKEVEGDLIALAKKGNFEVITHGCNCFCRMGKGIAPLMAKAFACDEYKLESDKFKGDMNKLGQIDYNLFDNTVYVVNSYSQYDYNASGKPLDYEALTLCLRKINHRFRGMKIGLPQIGCGLAGGDWAIVKKMIQKELVNCDVTVVIFK